MAFDFPLTASQRDIWFDQWVHSGLPLYNIGGHVRIDGPLDRARFTEALELLTAKHDHLRLVLAEPAAAGQAPRQRCLPRLAADPGWHDFSGEADAPARALDWMQRRFRQPFSLQPGRPLFRHDLVKVGEGCHYWLMQYHHLIADGAAIALLNDSMAGLYTALLRGEDGQRQAPSYLAQVRQDEAYLASPAFTRDRQYWLDKYRSLPERPFPARQGARAAAGAAPSGSLGLALPRDRYAGLQALAAAEGSSVFHLLLGALYVLWSRLSGQRDLVIGLPVANRTDAASRATGGLYVNVCAHRFDFDDRLGFRALLQGVRRMLARDWRHRRFPLGDLQRELGRQGGAGASLFDLSVSYEPHGHDVAFGPARGRSTALLNGAQQTPLTVFIREFHAEGEVRLDLVYNEAHFDTAAIEALQQRLPALLAAVLQAPDTPLHALPLLTAGERALMAAGNATHRPYPRDSSVAELFAAQVRRTPGAVALQHGGLQLSYAELDGRAERLARRLLGLGVQPGDAVAVVLPRSAELVVAELAVLRCGAVYVPLDPQAPPAWLETALQDCAARLLLTDTTARLPERPACRRLHVDALADEAAAPMAGQPLAWPTAAGGAAAARVMYTSGSSGRPKGVVVPHRAIARLVLDNGYADFGPGDRVAFASNPAFDASTLEVWAALLNGGRVVVLEQAVVLSAPRLAQALRAHGITVLWMTVGLFNRHALQLGSVLRQLRYLMVGGDRLDAALIAQVLRQHPPQRLLNGYGPTECGTFATTHAIERVDDPAEGIPIGRPIGNTTVHVLDAHRQPVPVGVAGELYIGGDGVALGYLGQPALSAERFLPDPFTAQPQARLYRSGDLGRWRSDGTLEFLGRSDTQVKIRGFRVEPGEIEAALACHPAVRQVTVQARSDGGAEKRLVAYYTAAGDEAADAASLREHLAGRLPDYLLPAAYVWLEQLPLTPNGKLDWRALPEPGVAAHAAAAFEPPRPGREAVLASLWRELLRLPRVGRQDHFFELGGHSLLAVSLIERLRRQGLVLDVRDLYATPTLAALAPTLEAAVAAPELPANGIPPGCTDIEPSMLGLVQLDRQEIGRIVARVPGGAANVQDIYPLAPLQEGILFHHLMARGADPYLLHGLYRFASRQRLDAFVQALQAVVDRHDILRTAVLWDGLKQPVQVVWRQAPVTVEEVALRPDEGPVAEQLEARFGPRSQRLDVQQAPMTRLWVAREGEQGGWLALQQFHHLVMDHTTLQVVWQEMGLLLQGRGQALPPPRPFRDFVAHARLAGPQQVRAQEDFFRSRLGDVEEPTLPFGLAEVSGDGAPLDAARIRLAPALLQQLRGVARAQGASLAGLLHLAFALVLGRVAGRQDVVFGTVLFGRLQGGEGADRMPGLFINTLPLRLRLKDAGVAEALRQVQAELAGLMGHEHAPLALAQRCSGVAAGSPLFSALLNYRHGEAGAADAEDGGSMPRWEGIELLHAEERSTYPLSLDVDDLGAAMALTARIAAPHSASRLLGWMTAALQALVAALQEAPATPLQALAVWPDDERQHWLAVSRGEPASDAGPAGVHQLFEAQAARTPEATALLQDDRRLSYRALNERANALARHLRELGVAPEQRVAVCLERSLELVVALLAVWKAGGAYVPLDPDLPTERLGQMLDDSQPVAVLVSTATRAVLHGLQMPGRVVDVEGDAALWAGRPVHDLDAGEAVAERLAYVIYTSGSTGLPKGVMNEHAGLRNRLLGMQADYRLQPRDVVLQKTPFGFDVSVWEFFWPLLAGAGLALARPQGHKDPAYLAEAIERYGVTTLHFVPSMLQLFVEQADPRRCASVQRVLCSGEALPGALAGRLRRMLPQARLYNLYGPTEAAIDVTAWPVDAATLPDSLPIGRPVSNTSIYVLDVEGRPTPMGAIGEIHIGGAQVARGYLNRPELTAERFVKDPFVDDPQARMYKTGDLGRWLADGTLEFLGRNDHQVKLRGFRIELGEIEARLLQHGAVREAVVLAREDQPGDKRLVAYVTLRSEASAEALKQHLAAQLPEYMVPAAYVVLPELPLTPNGKLDRRALPQPEGAAYVSRRYEAPVGEVEATLAGLWAELLKLERVGRHDHFFELGGHSLLAVRLLSRVRLALSVELGLDELFRRATPAALAQAVQGAVRSELPPIEAGAAQAGGPVALSFAQQRLWFLSQMEGASRAYHLPLALRLEGELDRGALRRALDRIVARHAALRTRFVAGADGQPVQVVEAEDRGWPLREHDLSEAPHAVQALAQEEAQQDFELERGPLVRGRLVKLGGQVHVLMLTLHHIVTDGWSMGVLLHELSALYGAYARGEGDPLAALPIQYADYAQWQRRWLGGAVQQEQLAYWRQALQGAPALLELPTDRPRPALQDHRGATVPIEIDEALTAAVKALAQRHGATPFMVVLAAYALVLGRLAGQHDVLIGGAGANRGRAELEPMIGLFVNTLVLRLDLAGPATVAGLLQRARDCTLQAQRHEALPFEQVVEALNPPRSAAYSPLFQAALAWQEGVDPIDGWAGLRVMPQAMPHPGAQFDLTLDLAEVQGRLVGGLHYASALFERSTIVRWSSCLCQALASMVADEQADIEAIDLLGDAQRQALLVDWNRTACPYPQDRCVHQLIESQVVRTPDAVALVQGDQALSYAEMNAEANRLARRLRQLGVVPDARVGLCLPRGPQMAVAVLAVLKAGGAYVPLDASYPAQRLQHMLQDSAPVVVLWAASVGEAVAQVLKQAAPLLDVEADRPLWQDEPADDLACATQPQHLAYVVYTSGSTGMPKGVAVEHRGVCNLAQAQVAGFGIEAGSRVLQFASFSFDAWVSEWVTALSCGGSLHFAPPGTVLAGEALLQALQQGRISHVTLPPAVLAGLPATATLAPVSTLVLAGEAASPALVQRWGEGRRVINAYGPSETTVCATMHRCEGPLQHSVPIGRPIANTRIYLLDAQGRVVPVGVAGEIHIGGAQLARGYLNRPELTAERFVKDPFVDDPQARMYKTGDLGRWLADGTLEFLGRNDHQVKLRGFRIELGEIEARLLQHGAVREAVVLAREDQPGDKRLVAYVTLSSEASAEVLKQHLAAQLPEYMVPAAYVVLPELPLTPNGKLDRAALPQPEGAAYISRGYEAPIGEVETTLAQLWAELLKVERVGRHDNFFELGGHSLLAVSLIERLRQAGLPLDVRSLFATPTLAALALSIGGGVAAVEVPPNRIPPGCTAIEPEMLSLVQLSRDEIAQVVASVPGGAANIQDIYPLAPLQEGILFHHLMADAEDVYLTPALIAFDSRQRLDAYLSALQAVIDRHDILRTSLCWEGLAEPVQVVWRRASLPVEVLRFDPAAGDVAAQLRARRGSGRLSLQQAPLMDVAVAEDRAQGRWLALQRFHHVVIDHTTLEILLQEIQALMLGQALPQPLPFRSFVAQARRGLPREEHERFFRQLLGGVDTPTLAFGLEPARLDVARLATARRRLDSGLARALREQARRLGLGAASLWHQVFALVLARLAGQDEVVFGTVLFGRMAGSAGADRVPGLYINTLPLRLDAGDKPVAEALRQAHAQLAALLRHEQAPLALAQRCSGVPAPQPLFNALLNYRHSRGDAGNPGAAAGWQGIEILSAEERSHYPMSVDIDDLGDDFLLTVQLPAELQPQRVGDWLVQAAEGLVQALAERPGQPLCEIEVLPPTERRRLLHGANDNAAELPGERSLAARFEAQARRTPDAIALVHEGLQLSYGELEAQANRLAHHLVAAGVGADEAVALWVPRSIEMVVAVLAVLKAGGAWVPLDVASPPERLAALLQDCKPRLLLAQALPGGAGLQPLQAACARLPQQLPVLDLVADAALWQHRPAQPPQAGARPGDLAYVIYTSGSTGAPKGVMVEHGGACNYLAALQAQAGFGPQDRVLQFAALHFDASVEEIFAALGTGATLVLRTDDWLADAERFWQLCETHGITVVDLPTRFWQQVSEAPAGVLPASVRLVIIAGEAVEPAALQRWLQRPGHRPRLFNAYGPTETSMIVTLHEPQPGDPVPACIGRPLANNRIYLLDRRGRPVPQGVAGEIHVGGAQLARGYLGRPDLTAERFVRDPFVDEPAARMYRTGDLGRLLPDGNLEFLGRNDFQLKLRGFRIEPAEIETRLLQHPAVAEAVVLARDDTPAGTQLVAYYTAPAGPLDALALREHLAQALPPHLMPAACMHLPRLPLNSAGKLDRRVLPAPDAQAYAAQAWEPPHPGIEATLARIIGELLQLERVGRHDSFFALGGHSLLAVSLIERLRREGLQADVRAVFAAPSVQALAASLQDAATAGGEGAAPPNRIPPQAHAITPDMLSLVTLAQGDIDRLVAQVQGGAPNVQDIYPLAPLQEGILFHHLMAARGDVYLSPALLAFDSWERLQAYLQALQAVVDRHDILRTAVLWEGLPQPVQVVWRRAPIAVETVLPDPQGPSVAEQLQARFDPRHWRMDVRQAPLLRVFVSHDAAHGRWLALQVSHHLCADHTTLEIVEQEVAAHLDGQADRLPAPLPFREFVARARRAAASAEHDTFFRELLGDVTEPTLPFGLQETPGLTEASDEARLDLPAGLVAALQQQARRLGVSTASLCHFAWAQVLARLCGRDDVVFGTVLFGRMQAGEGADRVPGLFINTLPLRLKLDATPLPDALRQTHERLARLLHHEHAPLALAQRCSGVAAPAPLFSALLNYRHSRPRASGQEPASRLWQGMQLLQAQEGTPYPLTLSVDDYGSALALTAQVRPPLQPQRLCSFMATALERLVQALQQTPWLPAQELDVWPDEERQAVAAWNATDAPYPQDRCIHELVEAQAVRAPNAPAVEQGGRHLDYAGLNAEANRLARLLRRRGVGPDRCVACCMERGPEMVVAWLAVLKAGGAYLPLDPALPGARLAAMIEDSAAVLLLGCGELPAGVAGTGVPVLDLGRDAGGWAGEPAHDLGREGQAPSDLAYVIYTSGSTGRPKGVMVEHRNLAHLVAWQQQAFGLAAGQRVSCVAGIGFDAAAWEVWPTLCSGATLLLAPPTRHDVAALLDWWQAQAMDLSFLPTPVAELALGAGLRPPGLRRLLVGGDRLRQRPPGLPFELINNYGPTEATVVATSGPVEPGEGLPGIGRPIANTRIHLLDARGRPVPVGVPGEIHIGGAGVARGYLGEPVLSAQRFLPDPQAAAPGARLYRTGDLARWLPGGEVEFLGRNDHQVKIRGLRIELGEIEACLAQHPAVAQAAVVVEGEEGSPRQRLLAYYRPSPGPAVAAEALHAHLAAALPAHMVPAAFMPLDTLPLTVNGKLDRRALPALPAAQAQPDSEAAAPVGALEAKLAEVWADVLQLDPLGRHDNFFSCGGNSLLAVGLVERLRQLGVPADVRLLFAAPTVAALAAALRGREAGVIEVPPNRIPPGCTRLTPELLPLVRLDAAAIEAIVASVPGGAANVQDIYPLAPLQEGILFHHLLAGRADPYLLRAVYRFADRAAVERFVGALQAVIDRHDILRTAVLWQGLPEAVQVVWRQAPVPVEEVQLDPAPGETATQLLKRLEATRRGLDIAQAPMTRLQVARDPVRGDWLVVQLAHHLVLDHTSLAIVRQEMLALMRDAAASLPPPQPFRDFVARARLEVPREQHEAYFRQLLGDVDTPTLAFDLADVQGDARRTVAASRVLEPALARRLRGQARALGVSLASLCHLAFAQVLARTSGRDDVVFGTVLLGRMGGAAASVPGLFINTLPVRILVGEASVQDSVRQVHRHLAELMRHEHAPLTLAQRCSAVPPPAPLFNTLFNYRHGDVAREVAGSEVEVLEEHEHSNYPLGLSVDDLGEGLAITAQAQAPVDAQRVCTYMVTALDGLAQALEQAPERPAREVEVLPEAERHALLQGWNDTRAPYADDRCFHELFEAEAARHADAPAVVQGIRVLSYAELNAQSNRLARHLRKLGVGPEVRVAICAERGPEMVVAVLAVLKAGGAYVPLNPEHPADRLAWQLRDSQPAVLLQHTRQPVAGLQELPAEVVRVDLWRDGHRWEHECSADLLRQGLTPRHLAYVIYTSGSTGQPKGVLLEHQGLCKLVAAQRQVFGPGPGRRVLQFASFSFDAWIYDLAMALCHGACLHFAKPGTVLAGDALVRTVRQQRITDATLPPAVLSALPEGTDWPTLHTLTAAGDICSEALVQRWAPGRRFFNGYGPTECTVWTTVHRCDPADTGRPPIGRPLPNTRVYVLDRHGRPAPVGVSGALYIGGVGVARGYLGRPALTDERFQPDPYAPEPGARRYRSGDLARWRADGSLEFLGREDFQVKLRGLRTEPGEAEARLQLHPDVREAVVLARDDGRGDKQLVAYYTTRSARPGEPLDPLALREHMAAALPEHLVPAAFVALPALPLTVHGKLDRAALPAPREAAYGQRGYEPPRGPVETALAALWAELLQLPRVGRHDGFVALGGHSILATQLLWRIREQFQVELPLRTLMQAADLAQLAHSIETAFAEGGRSGPMEPDTLDLRGEARLPPEIRPLGPLPATREAPVRAIFLTGATGFLGGFLLQELLQSSQADIHCLVRADDDAAAALRLRDALARYGLAEAAASPRVRAVAGHLEQPGFGLPAERLQRLAEAVDQIVHCAAVANFAYAYRQLKPANVLGTQEVLRLACRGVPKPVHHISTLSVLPQAPAGADAAPSDGYGQSKWVAERLVQEAGRRGLPVAVYRMGRITPHSATGACNPDDLGVRIARACLQAGALPDGDWSLPLSNVDHLARVIVRLVLQGDGLGGPVVHLPPAAQVSSRQLGQWLQDSGYLLRRMPAATLLEQLARAARHDPAHPLYTLVPMLPAAAVDDSTAAAAPPGEGTAPPTAASAAGSTAWQAGPAGAIPHPSPDPEMLRAVLAHLAGRGLINAPTTGWSTSSSQEELQA
ncbi:non-ribosomal peptide synthetase [Eleftheria terrae]|uniref:non-ribosomal peptide synthetase n=1 Tax=Eleftheria terrae TaxID=1597781 RepID=UPI00263AF040|nr:non-ribosomal peptide synthetase [Eleftheria terrae]WKB55711.1 amino acid adenylation domain-containing protein [Eleftheria terrae]